MRRSVSYALEHWRTEGLLSDDEVGILTASIERVQKPQDSARAVRIFGFIGAVLTGLGAILFVASNWDGLGPLERTLLLLAGYGLTVGAAVFTERRGLPLVAEAVWLLSTLVLGANIFLIAQNYNLSLTLWQGTFAWMIGALAMGYARQSTAQAAVAVPLGILTVGWFGGGSGWFFDDQMEFLFADGGLRPVFPVLGLALVALSTLLARRDDLRFARTPCFRWGTFITAGSLIITTIHTDLAAAFYNADFSPRQLAVIAVSVVLVGLAAVAGKVESPTSRVVMPIVLALVLATLVPAGETTWVGLEVNDVHVFFGLYVVAVFAMALLTIWLGMEARNTRLVNVGLVSTTLIIIIQYFGWSFDLLDRSLAFILGGLLLIALSVFVEKQRRRIMVRIAA